jgi:hypothetical protein
MNDATNALLMQCKELLAPHATDQSARGWEYIGVVNEIDAFLAASAPEQAVEPVAWNIRRPDGTVVFGNWLGMQEYKTSRRIATLREGCAYIFAYTLTTHRPADAADSKGVGDGNEYMCPNCVTPWKCNGPHIGDSPKHGYGDADTPQHGGDAVSDRAAQGGMEVLAWLHEDELPSGFPYDELFPYSKVDGVRMFPVYSPLAKFTEVNWREGNPPRQPDDRVGYTPACAVLLPEPAFDGGPIIRMAGFDHAVRSFICEATGVRIPEVTLWSAPLNALPAAPSQPEG